MSWLDALLGRTKPVKSDLDQLFGMSTGQITMQTELNLNPTGGAAISFRPVSSGEFARLQTEIDELMTSSSKDAALKWHSFTDTYGYRWTVLSCDDFSNLVATVHMISRELQDYAFGEQLLASVFQFQDSTGRKVYWIYNYKRGAFYPFVPAPNKQRDNAEELHLQAVMGRELHVDTDLEKWYALWGIPLD
ncbi:MAG: PspA-associated protein PspAB [Chloroflexota bacterium]